METHCTMHQNEKCRNPACQELSVQWGDCCVNTCSFYFWDTSFSPTSHCLTPWFSHCLCQFATEPFKISLHISSRSDQYWSGLLSFSLRTFCKYSCYLGCLFTFHFHALEEEMATHSSVLAWRIPGMAGPGGLPSMGSHRVGHD